MAQEVDVFVFVDSGHSLWNFCIKSVIAGC